MAPEIEHAMWAGDVPLSDVSRHDCRGILWSASRLTDRMHFPLAGAYRVHSDGVACGALSALAYAADMLAAATLAAEIERLLSEGK